METTFQKDLLKGKTALITGGATGICYGISLSFLKFGCTVCIMSRKQDVINKSVESLKQESGNPNVYGHTGDVRKPEQIEKAVDYFVEKVGKIDILINGAAGNFLAPLDKLSYNGFKTVVDIDLLGTYNTTKVVYDKSMKKNGGNIVNISAPQAYNGTLLQSGVGAAKAGIDNLTKTLAVELGPKKIRVNSVVPGYIGETEGMERLAKGQDDKMENQIPLSRLGKKEDIANSILYLVSDAASYVTGTILFVDGGSIQSYPNFTLGSKKIRAAWQAAKL